MKVTFTTEDGTVICQNTYSDQKLKELWGKVFADEKQDIYLSWLGTLGTEAARFYKL